MSRPTAVIPLAMVMAAAILFWSPSSGFTGAKDYYGPSHQRVTPDQYEDMIEQWYRCLDATETPAAFHECLEAPPPKEKAPPPETTGRVIPLLGPGPDEAEPPADPESKPAEPDAIAEPERADAPVAPESKPAEPDAIAEPERADAPVAPPADDGPSPAGSSEPPGPGEVDPDAPVRVIERDISIPGGGTMTVKEYQYE